MTQPETSTMDVLTGRFRGCGRIVPRGTRVFSWAYGLYCPDCDDTIKGLKMGFMGEIEGAFLCGSRPSQALTEAIEDWHAGRVYLDNAGNYRTWERPRRVTWWNREVKSLGLTCRDLHAAKERTDA